MHKVECAYRDFDFQPVEISAKGRGGEKGSRNAALEYVHRSYVGNALLELMLFPKVFVPCLLCCLRAG